MNYCQLQLLRFGGSGDLMLQTGAFRPLSTMQMSTPIASLRAQHPSHWQFQVRSSICNSPIQRPLLTSDGGMRPSSFFPAQACNSELAAMGWTL